MFEVGETYNRRLDIHGEYSGQQYGGISTPTDHPFIFIFTSAAGEAYGYRDGYGPDDTFWYTGEGQVGDMDMIKGNLAIKDHVTNKKEVLLFESVDTGQVRFVGKCFYITHHIEERPDKNGNLRNAIIFHLDIDQSFSQGLANSGADNSYEGEKKPTLSMSLIELRRIALRSTPSKASKKLVVANVQNRSKAIKLYVKKRADGFCEGCDANAPFKSKNGPYLEVHHMLRLADGGPDLPENVIALCPTCHRRAHYATDAIAYNSKLIAKMKTKESRIA